MFLLMGQWCRETTGREARDGPGGRGVESLSNPISKDLYAFLCCSHGGRGSVVHGRNVSVPTSQPEDLPPHGIFPVKEWYRAPARPPVDVKKRAVLPTSGLR
jgi:hypothetical protein